DPAGIAHDDGAVRTFCPSVTAAQDRGALPEFHQHPRDRRGKRRLAASAGGDVADADDRTAKAPARLGVRRVPLTAPARDRGVERRDHLTRNILTFAWRSGWSSCAIPSRLRARAPRLAST